MSLIASGVAACRRPRRVPIGSRTAMMEGVFLGDDLLAWLVLALGGALLFGNVAAIVRPPTGPREEGTLERAPIARSVVMAVVGLVAAVWAVASLVSG